MAEELGTYRARLGNHAVSLTCRSDFEDKARAFLDTLAELDAQPGAAIFFGGLLFRIAPTPSGLEVRQPDYLAEAPPKAGPGAEDAWATWVADVSDALVLLTAQLRVTSIIGVEPCDYRIDQTITVLKAAIEQERFYMVRQEPSSPNDSGWYLGSAEDAPQDHAPTNYTVVPLAALFRMRPAALRVLALPPGFLARFEGDALVGVGNEKDEEVYAR
ncbi:DUF2185 domain-containing protein [Pendulispora rubella]|uniref:DUF2185 domain-containing protein n=1 Tax=Pendulispora rubella TaxID=2741070 RepID=A0ABZ2LF12_9BACT